MRILWVPTETNLDGKLSLKASQKSYVEDSMETELDLIFDCLWVFSLRFTSKKQDKTIQEDQTTMVMTMICPSFWMKQIVWPAIKTWNSDKASGQGRTRNHIKLQR